MRVLIILLLLFLSCNSQDMSQTETYTLIKKIEQVEIREYKPLFFASYINTNTEETNQNSSFRVLANYIFGANKKEEKIAMTSPVIIRPFNNNEMLFRMPNKYNLDNIPEANNTKVKFIETPHTKKAILKYSGYSNRNKENKKIKELKEILERHGIKHNNMFEVLIYNSPYQMFNRRNEISVNILN